MTLRDPRVAAGLAEAVGNQLLHTVVPLMAVLDWLGGRKARTQPAGDPQKEQVAR
jgi:hypothetical protein